MSFFRSPGRSAVELGSSVGVNGGGGTTGLDEEVQRSEDELDTVEAVMNKLAIERRVQYGAEKMLDVIEKRSGGSAAADPEQVKERITAQLEAANEKIKVLEAKLEQLNRANGTSSGTPSRNRRRPQPRLNGYPSSSSLGLGQSVTSSNALSGPSRPRYARQYSNVTDDPNGYYLSRPEYGQGNRARANSATGSANSAGRGGSYRFSQPSSPRGARSEEEYEYLDGSLHSTGYGDRGGPSSDLGVSGYLEERVPPKKTEEANALISRLNEVSDELSRKDMEKIQRDVKGKGRAASPEDEVWDLISRLTVMMKRTERLKHSIDIESLVQSLVNLLGDRSASSVRAASYRLLRHICDRATWGTMISMGLEWLMIRTFTRDIKARQEKEQTIRLLRAVIMFPPPSRHFRRKFSSRGQSPVSGQNGSALGYDVRYDQSSRPSESIASASVGGSRVNGHGSSIHQSTMADDFEMIDELLSRRVPLTDGMVRALVSVAENVEDPMKIICMETLVELGLLDIDCLRRSDAFRTVLLTFKDGPIDLGPSITTLLLHLINLPASRQYLIPGSDLETILVGLTEEYGKISSRGRDRYMAKLQACIRNVGMLLTSWSGILYMCKDDFRAIKSLLGSLQCPIPEVREVVVDLLFETLRIRAPSWSQAFLDGKRLTVYNRTQEATSALQDSLDHDEAPPNLTLCDHYVAFLLVVFINAGLLENLVSLVEETDFALGRKATLLIGEILQMANRILPAEYAARLQSLPSLFTGALTFEKANDRHFALSALSSIDSLHRNQNKSVQRATREKSGNTQDSLERGKRQVEQVKLRIGLQIDDKQFQAMINETGVLMGRDHTKWNYEIIMELIEGPLLNPKRLDEAIKATKFVRRLFAFFHPYNYLFSNIKRTRPNQKWVKMGCSLLSTMLVNQEGIRFIQEDKLLKQLSDCFNELDQYAGVLVSAPVLARERLETTLTHGYFEMIGTLSRHTEGIKLMEKFKFFTSFYHLSEQRSRDDIIRVIVECFDYTIDAHPRIVLAKALTSAYMQTRLFATHHLAGLSQESSTLSDWALQLLITQLYDTSMEVCDVAVMYLEDLCTNSDNLEKVVQFRPALEHLGELGQPLFMRFVSTSDGFNYLHQAGYIEQELEAWMTERDLLYVIEVETFLQKALEPGSRARETDWVFEGTAPSHFFGELTKTPEGCQLLRERGIVPELAELLRLHGMESSDQGLMMNVKSALWALGNIGSTDGGFPFLEDEEIIEIIVEIAELSPVLTIKGTAFFAIGLLSTSQVGAETLEEFGYIATRTSLGRTTGLCLPNDLTKFTYIESWTRTEVESPRRIFPRLSDIEEEILTAIANLSNYVLANGAMNNLKRIRAKQPKYFASLKLFHRATHMISTNHYQAPVRRFILDLFDVQLSHSVISKLCELEFSSSAIYNRLRTQRVANYTYPIHRDHQQYQSPSPMDEVDQAGHEGTNDHDSRRRAASSPGPEPPGRLKRDRGLTISEIRNVRIDTGEEYTPRGRVEFPKA